MYCACDRDRVCAIMMALCFPCHLSQTDGWDAQLPEATGIIMTKISLSRTEIREPWAWNREDRGGETLTSSAEGCTKTLGLMQTSRPRIDQGFTTTATLSWLLQPPPSPFSPSVVARPHPRPGIVTVMTHIISHTDSGCIIVCVLSCVLFFLPSRFVSVTELDFVTACVFCPIAQPRGGCYGLYSRGLAVVLLLG